MRQPLEIQARAQIRSGMRPRRTEVLGKKTTSVGHMLSERGQASSVSRYGVMGDASVDGTRNLESRQGLWVREITGTRRRHCRKERPGCVRSNEEGVGGMGVTASTCSSDGLSSSSFE